MIAHCFCQRLLYDMVRILNVDWLSSAIVARHGLPLCITVLPWHWDTRFYIASQNASQSEWNTSAVLCESKTLTIACNGESTNKCGWKEQAAPSNLFRLGWKRARERERDDGKKNELYSRISFNFINVRDSDLHEIYYNVCHIPNGRFFYSDFFRVQTHKIELMLWSSNAVNFFPAFCTGAEKKLHQIFIHNARESTLESHSWPKPR